MKTGYIATTPGIEGMDLGEIYVSRDFFSVGKMWTCGENGSGELGNSSLVDTSSPVQVSILSTYWKTVSVGGTHSVAILGDGALMTWGLGTDGRLGAGAITTSSVPVQTISGGLNWKQASAGGFHTVAVKTDGTLWSWGSGLSGRLGDNSVASKSSPVQTLTGGTNWKQASAGVDYTTAIKTDGTLWSWGSNLNGRLGDGTTVNKSSPVQTVASGTTWKTVSSSNHTAAIKTDGSLWLWGTNTNGQLGDNSTTSKSSPVQTVSGGTNWKQVSAGINHTAAIKTNGTLWLWGQGASGELGNGDISDKSSPIQTVSDGNDWKFVSTGTNFTAAIKTDGTLWTWGINTSGQLANGNTSATMSPAQTVMGGTNWRTVCAGGGQFAAITYDEDF